MSSGFLTSGNQGGDRIYYETTGDGEKTIVFLHAGFVDSGMWDGQWQEFAATHRVVRYDQLGFGKSDPAQGPVARHEELARVLDELEIGQAVMVGCSQGGAAALDFALEHPARVSGLVLVSAVPNGFEMQGEPPAAMLEMFGALERGDTARISELQLALWMDGDSRQPHDVDAAVRDHAAAMNKIAVERNTFAIADMQPLNPVEPVAAGRLSDLQMPVLVIDGALDNSEILRAGDVMASDIADASKVVIQGGAHTPNMDEPAAFNQALRDFLNDKGL